MRKNRSAPHRPSTNTTTLKAIDLFCGVGGLTYGLRMAGIDVVAGIDNDLDCQYAYETNNTRSAFVHKDIRETTGKDLEPFWKGAGVKVLVGCAPCQTFSTHSAKIRKQRDLKKDTRWHLLGQFSRIIKEAEPDIVSMENVPLLVRQDVFNTFVKNLKKSGFIVSYQVVNCSQYGVPQNRKRLVLLASRTEKIEMRDELSRIRTVREAIADLPKIPAGGRCKKDPLHVAPKLDDTNLKRIQASKPGGAWTDWPDTLLPDCYKKESGSSYQSVYGRMRWDGVAPTLTTQFYRYGTGRYGHPEQHRALSLREGALLQTFPKQYRFLPPGEQVTFTRIGRHIGNAVPPSLGRAIGKTIALHLNKGANARA